MISEKLLSKILRAPIQEFKINNEGNIDFVFLGTYDEWKVINIHELAHMCKEWAYNKGIAIDSCFQTAVIHLDKPIEIKASTEPEAIFQACEWILDKEKENG